MYNTFKYDILNTNTYRRTKMGKTAYNRCVDFMKFVKQKGYDNEIDIRSLNDLIKMFLGGDNRTQGKYYQLLREFKFIDRISDRTFKIKEVYTKLY